MDSEMAKTQRPPYWLGLLCLIPLVGAFVGLGLLLYGIIKYKDKWLVMIGAFGIAWTIFIRGLAKNTGFSPWALMVLRGRKMIFTRTLTYPTAAGSG
jgi:hypothetical protein